MVGKHPCEGGAARLAADREREGAKLPLSTDPSARPRPPSPSSRPQLGSVVRGELHRRSGRPADRGASRVDRVRCLCHATGSQGEHHTETSGYGWRGAIKETARARKRLTCEPSWLCCVVRGHSGHMAMVFCEILYKGFSVVATSTVFTLYEHTAHSHCPPPCPSPRRGGIHISATQSFSFSLQQKHHFILLGLTHTFPKLFIPDFELLFHLWRPSALFTSDSQLELVSLHRTQFGNRPGGAGWMLNSWFCISNQR